MNTLKKLTFDLNGLGSILDLFPSSDLEAKMAEIVELTNHMLELQGRATPKQSRTQTRLFASHYTLASYGVETTCRADRDALAGDWQSVGGDFLNAYEKLTKNQHKPLRKEESDCGMI